jgi:hypothetical protein
MHVAEIAPTALVESKGQRAGAVVSFLWKLARPEK